MNDWSARPSQRAAWLEMIDASGISGSGRPCRRTSTASAECGVEHAIAFVPTVVSVLDARVVGNRVYIVLLLADDDGAASIDRLTDAGADEL